MLARSAAHHPPQRLVLKFACAGCAQCALPSCVAPLLSTVRNLSTELAFSYASKVNDLDGHTVHVLTHAGYARGLGQRVWSPRPQAQDCGRERWARRQDVTVQVSKTTSSSAAFGNEHLEYLEHQ